MAFVSAEEKIKLRAAINDIVSVLDTEPNWQDGAYEDRTFTERDLHLLIDAGFEKSAFGNAWSGKIGSYYYFVNFTDKGAIWNMSTPNQFNVQLGTKTYNEAREICNGR